MICVRGRGGREGGGKMWSYCGDYEDCGKIPCEL